MGQPAASDQTGFTLSCDGDGKTERERGFVWVLNYSVFIPSFVLSYLLGYKAEHFVCFSVCDIMNLTVSELLLCRVVNRCVQISLYLYLSISIFCFYSSAPLQFGGKYCNLYSTTFSLIMLVTLQI